MGNVVLPNTPLWEYCKEIGELDAIEVAESNANAEGSGHFLDNEGYAENLIRPGVFARLATWLPIWERPMGKERISPVFISLAATIYQSEALSDQDAALLHDMAEGLFDHTKADRATGAPSKRSQSFGTVWSCAALSLPLLATALLTLPRNANLGLAAVVTAGVGTALYSDYKSSHLIDAAAASVVSTVLLSEELIGLLNRSFRIAYETDLLEMGYSITGAQPPRTRLEHMHRKRKKSLLLTSLARCGPVIVTAYAAVGKAVACDFPTISLVELAQNSCDVAVEDLCMTQDQWECDTGISIGSLREQCRLVELVVSHTLRRLAVLCVALTRYWPESTQTGARQKLSQPMIMYGSHTIAKAVKSLPMWLTELGTKVQTATQPLLAALQQTTALPPRLEVERKYRPSIGKEEAALHRSVHCVDSTLHAALVTARECAEALSLANDGEKKDTVDYEAIKRGLQEVQARVVSVTQDLCDAETALSLLLPDPAPLEAEAHALGAAQAKNGCDDFSAADSDALPRATVGTFEATGGEKHTEKHTDIPLPPLSREEKEARYRAHQLAEEIMRETRHLPAVLMTELKAVLNTLDMDREVP